MADKSKIEWTDATWNPVRGCSKVSEGCRNCYAMGVAARFSGLKDGKPLPYYGLAKRTPQGPAWTGKVRVVEEHLEDPLRWQRPRRIFVNSMSDLFHEGLEDHEIARIFHVMALAKQHSFQVLTKRADRMSKWMNDPGARALVIEAEGDADWAATPWPTVWPPPNVWIGVSVEDQKSADERIPLLLRAPAPVRFLSCEPLLGPVDLRRLPFVGPRFFVDALEGYRELDGTHRQVDWVIVGGESGPRARPFDLAWARSIVGQCATTGVPCFVKQLGAVPFHRPADTNWAVTLRSKKGGDPAEWPEDLRVRQFPEVNHG